MRGEPFAEDARYYNQQDEIRRDGAESDVKGPEWRQERNERVDDVYPLGEDLGHDVDDQECQRTEGDRTVYSLRHHPVSWPHNHPVSGYEADQHRAGEADECENSRIKQHEMLGSSINVMASRGHDQHRKDKDSHRDHGGHDLALVIAGRPMPSRVHTLTTA
ncbi:MAG: hypothetical protein M3Z75_14215 [Actinomycetota bacterium]|nr:hypothetical protein [Actinomycetota bacterium]